VEEIPPKPREQMKRNEKIEEKEQEFEKEENN